MERRYCQTCHVEQFVRTKHCKDCNRCVATFDHHCQWIGNCIGEKNRCIFWWYLLFQEAQISFSAFMLFRTTILQLFSFNIFLVIYYSFVFLVEIFFLVMLSSLLMYHSYLATTNQTTWENLSWSKITYLEELDESEGSPFSEGGLKNLLLYCKFRMRTKQFIDWKPTSLF